MVGGQEQGPKEATQSCKSPFPHPVNLLTIIKEMCRSLNEILIPYIIGKQALLLDEMIWIVGLDQIHDV